MGGALSLHGAADFALQGAYFSFRAGHVFWMVGDGNSDGPAAVCEGLAAAECLKGYDEKA
jgi:hypothetical protein